LFTRFRRVSTEGPMKASCDFRCPKYLLMSVALSSALWVVSASLGLLGSSLSNHSPPPLAPDKAGDPTFPARDQP